MEMLKNLEVVLKSADPDIMNDSSVPIVDLLEDEGFEVYIDSVLDPHKGYLCSVDGYDIYEISDDDGLYGLEVFEKIRHKSEFTVEF